MAEDDDTDGTDEGEQISIQPGSSKDARWLALWALLAEFLRRLLGVLFEDEVSRVRRKVDDVYGRFRRITVLASATLAFALLTFLVWTLVGVVWLVQNTPAPSDPAYFVAGIAVGYLASLVAGLVYSR